MLKNPVVIFKFIFIVILVLYMNYFESTLYTNKIEAFLTLVFSLMLLIKSRNNSLVSLAAFFILYCNYSIVIGEYFVGGNLAVPIFEVKTILNYGTSIRTLLLFTAVISVFYNGKSIEFSKLKLIPKDNVMIFSYLFLFLVYILLFGIKRNDLTSYSVNITPMYEYSTIVFLFAYYFSGKSKIRQILLVGLLLVFVLQDFYYGGRITSLQLIFLSLLTIYLKNLSYKFIITFGFVGVLINSFVGAYRESYSINGLNIFNIFSDLKNGFFVFSTPIYAYYASATHVAASAVVTTKTKFESLISFIGSLFVGSNSEMSSVTKYVSNHHFYNIGGGVIPTHFYFWMGWLGVVIIATAIVLFFNKVWLLKSDFQKLCAILIIVTLPRWYLYSPLSLFRPLVFLSILYLFSVVAHHVLNGTAKEIKSIEKTDYTNRYSN